MTSRARSKVYQPVLATVHRWTAGAVIFRSVATQRTFMVPQSVCLIQIVVDSTIDLDPVPATQFDEITQGEAMERATCIAWVPTWKLQELEEESNVVPVMTPPTPKAKQRAKS